MEGIDSTPFSQTLLDTTTMYFNLSESVTSLDTTTPENLVVTLSNFVPIVYCGESWANFWKFLGPANAPTRIIVCIVGIITNILNILVFTRKPMRNPTNTILIALCVSDLLCLLRLFEYIGVAYLKPGLSVHGDPGWNYTYFKAIHNFTSEILVNLFNSWSVYLTITISLWRLMGVSQPLRSLRWSTQKGAKAVIFASILIGLIIMIPMYCYAYIRVTTNNNQGELLPEPKYQWTLSVDWAWHLYLWTHIIFIKVAPCTILTIVTVILVLYLVKAQKSRSKMMKPETTRRPEGKEVQGAKRNEKVEETAQSQKQKLEYDRITRILIIVVVVFVVTEFPFGLINLLNSFLGHDFFIQCKKPALPFLNIVEFLSSATNFFVYSFMSKSFRSNFYQLFTPSISSNSNSKSFTYYDSKSASTVVSMDSHV